MNVDQYQIEVRDRTGEVLPGRISVSENGDDYNVSLVFRDVSLSETASDAFDAFAKIRTLLSEQGCTPWCYGSSKAVFPSGMSRNMGGGVMAYRLTLGRQALQNDLVCIFDTGPGIEPVSPEEQQEFFNLWLASLRTNAG